MKKEKKKGASKKSWVVDCRTDSAFNFALKVLKEAENDKYSNSLRANFAKIAYSNSCEAIAKAQTDPQHYKLKSAFKLFVRNLKEIYKVCETLFKGYTIGTNAKYHSVYKDITDYMNIIDNPFDYVDINYSMIEEALKTAKLYRDNVSKISPKELLDLSTKRYHYPKIYEYVSYKSCNDEVDVKILPTNDIAITLPAYVLEVFDHINIDGEYSDEHTTDNIDNFVSLIRGQSTITKEGQSISSLIHVPNDSFSNISGLIEEASVYPENVSKICITAYRLGKNSPIISHIITATRNGIKCKLYLELSARGEIEQDLIYLDRLMNDANLDNLDIKIQYNGIKVHGKMIYIELKGDRPSIGVFSTGNYNATTAKIYKDYHYITTDKNSTTMIKRNFEVLWNSEQPVLSSISNILAKEIYEEIAKGKDGRIWIQTNHLDNKLIVSLLKEAIRRGCDVKLIVRTTKGFHNRELKNCKTVVGKYLEHSRVYIFGYGKEKRVYLSSSDILFRNLYNRFESYINISNFVDKDTLINNFKDLYKNGQKL